VKQSKPATPDQPFTDEAGPPPISDGFAAVRAALEHAEVNCDNAVRFLSQKWPDTPDLCVQSEDIERTALALQALCELMRPIVDRLQALEHRTLIDEYKCRLSYLLARRALGPLTMVEEGQLAGEQEDIWNQLSEDDRSELEEWIEVKMSRFREHAEKLGP
jgi:hypothetical protein